MSRSNEDIREEGRSLLERGAGIEDLLKFLRHQGLGILDSIRLVRQLSGVSLGEAKKLVHLSGAWADLRESNDSFHDQLLTTVKEIAEQRPESVSITELTDAKGNDKKVE